MARMLIWNAISARRRAASDNFMENGLAQLRGAALDQGHEVVLADWARDGFHRGLAPGWLTRGCRRLLAAAMRFGGAGQTRRAKLCWAASLPLQALQTAIRNRRMRARIRELAADVVRQGIKLVGVKLWYGEALEWSEFLLREIRRRDPEAVFVAGGPLVSIYSEQVLLDTEFDIGVVANGEEPLCRLLQAADEAGPVWSREAVLVRIRAMIAAGELRNVVYRDNGAVRVSERYPLDFAYSILPAYSGEDLAGKGRIHVLRTSLGCSWGKCNFCVHPKVYPGYCPRPVDGVMAELKAVIPSGVGFFRFAGSDTPPELGAEVARRLLAEGLTVGFGIGLRGVRGILAERKYRETVADFELMFRAGLRSVFMGGESGHAGINDKVMNKGLHPDEIVATIAAVREAARRTGRPVDVGLAVIHPSPLLPGVTQEEVFQATVDMIERARPDAVAINPAAPFPGTVWHTEAGRFGFRLAKDIVHQAMRYEFVPYKPPTMWPEVGITLDGRSFAEMLSECQRLRRKVEAMGLPTDLAGEHFCLMRSAGESDLHSFKRETLLDILSGDYAYTDECFRKTNAASERLARKNLRQLLAPPKAAPRTSATAGAGVRPASRIVAALSAGSSGSSGSN
jgi:radical SAM superfamily enzyme YgiQ (UPF0313 family)